MTSPGPDVAFCKGCERGFKDSEWVALEWVGLQGEPTDILLELRNCACGSTISAVLFDAEPPTHERG